MKIADGELRQILLHDLKLPAQTVRELVADGRQTNHSLIQIVSHSKLVDPKKLAKAHAKRIGVPFIDLETESIAPRTILRIPRQIAAKYHVICFDETTTGVKIAMADPRNERARQAIRDYTGKTVRRYLASDTGLRQSMQVYNKADKSPLPLSSRQLLAIILEQAARSGSREVYFEPNHNQLLVKRRAGGTLKTMSTLPLYRYQGLISWCKLQVGGDINDQTRTQHGYFTMNIANASYSIMVSTLPIIGGEKMMLRLIPPAKRIPSLKKLGYAPNQIKLINAVLTDGRGLIIVAGGKHGEVPCTLARLAADASLQPSAAVSTIEESTHFHLPNVSQTEITSALSLTDGIAAVIAQNPQVIVTSSLGKGAEAAQLVDFALSHHLVIAGAYGTKLSTLTRHLQSYPLVPALLAASLRMIIVQHNALQLCKSCRVEFKPVGPLKKVLHAQLKLDDTAHFYREGTGCANCDNGSIGTIIIPELLNITTHLQQLLATGADQTTLQAALTDQSDLIAQVGQLASDGQISIDQATRLVA